MSDATMLLTATPTDRARMLEDRQITETDITEARESLKLPAEDEADIDNVLDELIRNHSASDPGNDEAEVATPPPDSSATSTHAPGPS